MLQKATQLLGQLCVPVLMRLESILTPWLWPVPLVLGGCSLWPKMEAAISQPPRYLGEREHARLISRCSLSCYKAKTLRQRGERVNEKVMSASLANIETRTRCQHICNY